MIGTVYIQLRAVISKRLTVAHKRETVIRQCVRVAQISDFSHSVSERLENIPQVTCTDVGIVRCQVSHAPLRIWCHGVLFPNGFSFGFFV